MPDALAPLPIAVEARDPLEAKLIGMVLDGVNSLHSRRAYEKGLRQFFVWCRQKPRPSFSKALANAYRSWLLAQGLAPSTINLRLSPIRKFTREMADNHLLAPRHGRGHRARAGGQAGRRPGRKLAAQS